MEPANQDMAKNYAPGPDGPPPSYDKTNAGYDQPGSYGQAPTVGQMNAYGQPAAHGQINAYGQPAAHGQINAYGQPGYGPTPQPVMSSTNNVNVVVSQPQMNVVGMLHRPSDGMVLAIVSCFFCWPMAICALVYASSSRSAADTGDFAKATSDGRSARGIGIAAIILGSICIVIGIILRVVLVTSEYAYCVNC